MYSPDPRAPEPICNNCHESPIPGRLRCAECQARWCFDRDESREVDALVADDFLTRERADQIGRECTDYVAWARAKNAAAMGRMV